ncbi:hypothetical protein AVCANL279_07325 [Campylobacter canadensis]|uniref:hypothetical protein n=1 Tax=Campylobacter canadensis TaxID=449520 RepID=UPI0015534F88|nr:hypothetical protein [Campylobacter canadensis]MBZ7995174.1 hypothetical protein [Campylobacter canadensis]MBZ7997129.1 hypothetical protein [Campylobacter canadensis]MBZ8000538.1 hypothetical protein [Campylobacter canadensis]MBZ8003849.1 hypothetical protein [Campylobacter canadensis]
MKLRSPRFYLDTKLLNELKIAANYYKVSPSFLCELAIEFYKGKRYEKKLQARICLLSTKKHNKKNKKYCKKQKNFTKQSLRGVIKELFR